MLVYYTHLLTIITEGIQIYLMYYLKIKHVNLLCIICIFMILLSPNTDTLKLAHIEINLRRRQ